MWPYTDVPIPAPATWSRAEAHAGMDDMGEHALRDGRITAGELDQIIEERFHRAAQIVDSMGTCMPPMPGEACTEIGAHSSAPRPRLGALQPWERKLLNAKAVTWAVLSIGFLLLVLWGTKP